MIDSHAELADFATASARHRVFVYGTLKRGFPYFDIAMRTHRFVGRFLTRERYPLVIAGAWYSPTLIFEPGRGHRVIGEVFEVDTAGLAHLDDFEGTDSPAGYRRTTIAVAAEADKTESEAWAYVKDRARIDVIHSQMLAEYPLDPRYLPASKR